MLANLHASVLAWAVEHGRDLPWRHTRDPWAILVSEVMAQQTQVDRVIPKWTAFLQLWPDPQACAGAPLGDVLRVWQGLGYPRRAKNLHDAASQISAAVHAGGHFPNTLSELMALPGVGPYTARAVMAFAYEADVAVVDTNTARVLARWENRQLDRRSVQAAADVAVPPGSGWAWNQAMLDLGATVCTLRNPSCERCPTRNFCSYGGIGVDPAVGTAGVSVRQARFAGSDRQIRGRILRVAGSQRLSMNNLSELVEAVGLVNIDGRKRAATLVQSLIDDGLLETFDGWLQLPK